MMTEDKDILAKDLSVRLPYGVKVAYMTLSDNMPKEWDMIGLPTVGLVDVIVPGRYRFAAVPVEEVKPYLRPMSSMTDDECEEFFEIVEDVLRCGEKGYSCVLSSKQQEWLDAHHFDYRGLIEKGLALEAPEGMYKTE